MMLEADLIILGGGCAGLSLAARLTRQQKPLRFIVVEPRSHYEEDRTWCGWRVAPHVFSDCCVAEWKQWRIITPQGPLLLGSEQYPYEMVRSSLFYEKAVAMLAASTTSHLLQNARATSVEDTGEAVIVGLDDGRSLTAPFVVDTRPDGRLVLQSPWLWQNFVGYVVQVQPSAHSALDAIPTLMEFQRPGPSVAQFMYVLPMHAGCYLCECTRFSTIRGEQEDLEAALGAWLDRNAGPGWLLHRRESGSLPMAPPGRQPGGRIIAAGTRGGSMRASTGYAFHRIQRWADACADALLTSGRPIPPQRNRVLDAMDLLFLEVLQQPSTSAADVLSLLFRSAPPDPLVRFLSGIPRGTDFWPIVRGLPWAKFMAAMPSLLGTEEQA
jgi:lycopene beta-cyclase